MNKLTADSARQELTKLKAWEGDCVLTLKEELYLQALEIALPVLEQKTHESVIAEQLEAVKDSLKLNPHQNAVISCAIDRLNELNLRVVELSRVATDQNRGWIGVGDWLPTDCEPVTVADHGTDIE